MRPGKTWLFDLDNTLHHATPHIFPHINRSMREYIERHLGFNEEEATRIRQEYWVHYGATLLGLVRHHGTDPDHRPRHGAYGHDPESALRRHPDVHL